MILYDFIEQRFDELDYFERMEMVDTLLDRNVTKFKQEDHEVDAICLELWQEDHTNDIPF